MSLSREVIRCNSRASPELALSRVHSDHPSFAVHSTLSSAIVSREVERSNSRASLELAPYGVHVNHPSFAMINAPYRGTLSREVERGGVIAASTRASSIVHVNHIMQHVFAAHHTTRLSQIVKSSISATPREYAFWHGTSLCANLYPCPVTPAIEIWKVYKSESRAILERESDVTLLSTK